VTGDGSRSFVLRARHVLPMAGPPLENGWIRVVAGRVAALGRGASPRGAVDLGDCIVLPGLVNAHTHLEFSDLAAPLAADGGLPAWIRRIVALRRSREQLPDAEARREAAVTRGLRETAAAGVTAVGEISTGVGDGGYPARGPRVRVFREAIGIAPGPAAAAFRRVIRDLDRLASRRSPAGLSPHAPYSVAAPLGRRLIAEARRRRLPVAMHVAEDAEERQLLGDGTGPFRELLEELGAWPPGGPPPLLGAAEWITRLARASRGIVVHATHLEGEPGALARLARHRDRLCVAVCPRTTRALAGRLPPVAALRAAGLRIAIGTDSRASNPDLSVRAECRTLVEAGLASPAEAVAMATVNGAWALGFDRRCGRLAPGGSADLAVFRADAGRAEPHEAVLDPAAVHGATFRGGRLIAGAVPGAAAPRDLLD
jgi:cytosine/adenosine deaminase-related metal-dependent hydrolase